MLCPVDIVCGLRYAQRAHKCDLFLLHLICIDPPAMTLQYRESFGAPESEGAALVMCFIWQIFCLAHILFSLSFLSSEFKLTIRVLAKESTRLCLLLGSALLAVL